MGLMMEYKPKVGDLVQFKRRFYEMSLSERQSAPGPANMSDMEYWYGPHTDRWIGVVVQTGIKMGSWGGESKDDIPEGCKICWHAGSHGTVVSEYLTSYITEVEPIPEEKKLDKASGE